MADQTGRSYDPSRDATAQEPLTDNEKKLVTRLFGDPFAFPMEFKAWLRGWLEEQFPRIGSLAVSAESGAAGAFVPPAGAILLYGGDTAPGGYVMCDGAEYDRTGLAYQRLYNAIGFKYGTGSTENHFRVPDFQGRIAVGKGTHADVDALGDSEGVPVGDRRPRHKHDATLPDHTHGLADSTHQHTYEKVVAGGVDSFMAAGSEVGVESAWSGDGWIGYTATDNPSTHPGIPVGPQVNVATDTPAYLVVNKIISLGS